MTLDNDARRIREAFNRELADCHAPADLAERARQGGQRRAAKRRLLVTAGLAAAAARRALAGTRPRWRVGRLAAGGLGLAVAGGIFAAVALQPASPRPVTGPGGGSTRLAAWTVIRQPDGGVAIYIRQMRNAAALQARLRKDGVPVRVQFLTPGFIRRHRHDRRIAQWVPRPCSVIDLSEKAWAPLDRKVFSHPLRPTNKRGVYKDPPGMAGLAFIIHPSAIPAGTGLLLQMGSWGSDTFYVKATPACTGP
jgi:hypothetical protein